MMRPGQLHPNELERAILNRLAKRHPSLQGPFEELRVTSRTFTGVGCYTEFHCDGVSQEDPETDIDLDDETIHIPGVPHGLGVTLFCKGGRPEVLELYTFGFVHWDGVYDGFSIGPSDAWGGRLGRAT